MRTLDVRPNTEEWLAERRKYDTASEAPVMMGASKKATRSDLLKIKSTGVEKEHSEWVEKNLFANGHEVEANARPIAEGIVGEELYPAVGVSDDDELLASFDGITMLESVIWECKQMNAEKAAAVEAGTCPDEDYWQVVQQLAVSDAEKCLYMVTDGTEENMVYCWVTPDVDDIQMLRDGWAQFRKDLADYEPPAAEKIVTGAAPSALPALRIELSGAVAESNLEEFRDHALAVFDGISTDLQTDEQFADAEETVKWCKTVEQKLSAAKDHALSQTEDIDRLFRTIDEISEQARKKRLELDKLVKSMKEQRKAEILRSAQSDLAEHVSALHDEISGLCDWDVTLSMPACNIAEAMKGKRTIATLQDAADTAVANAKIEADRIAREIRVNIDALEDESAGHETLFPDGGQLVTTKTTEDLRNLARTRIAEHQEQERQRAEREAEQQRIREERRTAQERERQQSQQNPTTDRPSSPEPTVAGKGTQAKTSAGATDCPPVTATRRPADDQIIACIADAFNVDHATARDWIAGMNMIGAEA